MLKNVNPIEYVQCDVFHKLVSIINNRQNLNSFVWNYSEKWMLSVFYIVSLSDTVQREILSIVFVAKNLVLRKNPMII